MGISTQRVKLDINKQASMQVLRLGQGDRNGTTLVAELYDGGSPYSLSGKTARFTMRTPDRQSSYSVASSSTSNNTATFNIDERYAAGVAGTTDVAYIEVLSGSTVICSTSRMRVICLQSATEGVSPSQMHDNGLDAAIAAANTAASSANTAASNANTKASRAETATTSANTARDNANTAASAANTAASAATTAAGSATTAAEAANTSKDAANAAATAANTAAGSANAATSEANAAIEAMGDISELAVPEMTANVRGGAKVGGSTQVIGGKLEVKLSESATGTSVTTGSTSALRELQVRGKSVQDGTPTPDAPVAVQVVEGRNLLPLAAQTVTNRGVTATVDNTGTVTITGTATGGNAALTIPVASDVPLANNIDYTAQRITVSGSLDGTFYVRGIDDTNQTMHHLFNLASVTERTARFTNNAIMQAIYIVVSENTTIDCVLHVQVEQSSTPTSYVPYGCIGLKVNDTITPIDLQGNTLASLPDGTLDELHIDSAGRVWIEKRTGRILTPTDVSNVINLIQITGGARWKINVDGLNSEEILDGNTNGYCSHTPFKRSISLGSLGSHVYTYGGQAFYVIEGDFTASTAVTWVNSHQMTIIYPLATPQTIDLGYITPPAIPSGSVVTISASLTPTFDLACWTEHASELADTTATLANEISSLRAQIAALATS